MKKEAEMKAAAANALIEHRAKREEAAAAALAAHKAAEEAEKTAAANETNPWTTICTYASPVTHVHLWALQSALLGRFVEHRSRCAPLPALHG